MTMLFEKLACVLAYFPEDFIRLYYCRVLRVSTTSKRYAMRGCCVGGECCVCCCVSVELLLSHGGDGGGACWPPNLHHGGRRRIKLIYKART